VQVIIFDMKKWAQKTIFKVFLVTKSVRKFQSVREQQTKSNARFACVLHLMFELTGWRSDHDHNGPSDLAGKHPCKPAL